MEKVQSFEELKNKINTAERSMLLLYRDGSEQSMCAYRNLYDATGDVKDLAVLTADVTGVRDIHQQYGITSVPSLLLFEKGNITGVIKGCHETGYYKSLAENSSMGVSSATGNGKAAKRVTVYSTPTCTWCNTLKTWLNKNNIRYTDIDVSGDQRAAEELVRRSGQQGVPQTDINGRIVVGFDQNKLKELLEIQ
ncbi:MAG TPA: glutaredoxin domain-containing protein [Bacteroidales bacterium]|nr:glutaredoxin domain-containing protein [Bacteroidales bacterium]